MTESELKLFLSQRLVEMADALLAYYDPCALHGETCRAYEAHNRCCENGTFGKGLCPYFVDGKCIFPNPACKLWLCRTAVSASDPTAVQALTTLEQFAALYGLARRPFIGQPYSGADRQSKG